MDSERKLIIGREFTSFGRISLPDYTTGEEIFNSVSHAVGAMLGSAATALCLMKASNGWAIASAIVYGFTLMLMFSVSTVYHALPRCRAKGVLRVIDHCDIYLFIAGTYTPYTLISLRDGIGWLLFAAVWCAAITALVFNAIDLKKYRVVSFIAYLLTGWAIVAALSPLGEAIGTGGVALLLAGGACYTFGALLYVIGKKYRYMHSIFHVFVLAGSILHFFSIYYYVM